MIVYTVHVLNKLSIPYIKRVLKFAIPLFCIKLLEYKIVNTERLSIYLIVSNSQKLLQDFNIRKGVLLAVLLGYKFLAFN